jgi:hypothetical protein
MKRSRGVGFKLKLKNEKKKKKDLFEGRKKKSGILRDDQEKEEESRDPGNCCRSFRNFIFFLYAFIPPLSHSSIDQSNITGCDRKISL